MNAQDYRAKVQGVVTDTSQAIAAGATVTLINTKTGIRTAKQSSATGQYVFEYVEPGDYEVDVELQGFTKFVQKNVAIQARGDVTVNAMLRPGSTHESVVVEA
ncbi:MAG: carboxypeptidase regulatory-like domain-containing protein, partial [Acidobacteriota bacterium]|nr:carboxypeptidase regulatory-like domain-containing protein [Acidobacteriota bacterium]